MRNKPDPPIDSNGCRRVHVDLDAELVDEFAILCIRAKLTRKAGFTAALTEYISRSQFGVKKNGNEDRNEDRTEDRSEDRRPQPRRRSA